MPQISSLQDRTIRDRALDPSRSFIVQAPAGSGKTELLIRRFLMLLAHAQDPEEIVAITFTRKAAYEMRERVLQALYAETEDTLADTAHQQLIDLASAARARNDQKGWELEKHPSRLRIRTIDSVCRMLVERMPWLSGFGASPAVVEDASTMYLEAAQATLSLLGDADQAWSGAVEALLTHFDNNFAKVAQLLVAMLARRDQWLRHVVADGTGEQQRSQLENAWSDLVQDALQQVAATIPPGLVDELVDCAAFAATNRETKIALCRGLTTLPSADASDLQRWQGLAELLLTQKNLWRLSVDLRTGFPANKDPKSVEMKTRMRKLLSELAGEHRLLECLTLVRKLPDPRFDDSQWRVLSALIELLPLAVAELRMSFQRAGQVDFLEVAQRAVESLGQPERPTDLALVMDYRIRHLLVDEFQDTSRVQFDLLERLTAGWEAGDGRTLFLVGDPMQSIYRFRDADVGLYLYAERHGIGGIKLEPLRLSVNFRCTTTMLDWVNASFKVVFPTISEVASGAVSYSPAIAAQPVARASGVHVHPLPTSDRTVEAKQVLHLIQMARAQDAEGSIAILVRNRSDLTEILRLFKEEEIVYRGVDLESLVSKPVVQDLLSLTRALLHPADKVAWLALLRAPWCGLTLSDLLWLVGRDEPEATVWQRICDTRVLARLSADGRHRIGRVKDVLHRALTLRGRLALRDWVEQTWIELGGSVCVPPYALDDAEVLLGVIEQLDCGGDVIDLKSLHTAANELWAQPRRSAEDAVHVMTIHKAKGLEFDTVIVPGLARVARTDEGRLLHWEERVGAADNVGLLLAPLGETGGERDQAHAYLKSLEADKNALELGRLLYVACTRAKQHLHLLGHAAVNDRGEPATPPSHSLLSKLWPAVSSQFAAAPAQTNLVGNAATSQTKARRKRSNVIYRLPTDWSPPFTYLPHIRDLTSTSVLEDSVEFEWASDTARHVGTLVHRLINIMAKQELSVWSGERSSMHRRWRAVLLGFGVPVSEVDHAVQRVDQAVQRVLVDPRVVWIFDRCHSDAHSEYALTGLYQGQLIRVVMDRTFIDEHDTRWIVDFKTSVHEGTQIDKFLDQEVDRYRGQLERYAVIMKARDPRPIRLALYFPLLTAWREWSSESNGQGDSLPGC
ncbi:MAG: UvrD-helicase domain-containing protein [Gammaproteobacteria bacterium]|nr:UvrD-helicase domain-containing protein [Gammaproteobacteria bacterium]